MPDLFDQDAGIDSTLAYERISKEELLALREQAAQMIPYKAEAERLADALYNFNPDHPLLRSDLWRERMQKRRDADPNEDGFSPDSEIADAIARNVRHDDVPGNPMQIEDYGQLPQDEPSID